MAAKFVCLLSPILEGELLDDAMPRVAKAVNKQNWSKWTVGQGSLHRADIIVTRYRGQGMKHRQRYIYI